MALRWDVQAEKRESLSFRPFFGSLQVHSCCVIVVLFNTSIQLDYEVGIFGTHWMRNEMYFRLKGLHRPVQCSRFCPGRDQKYLCLMETGEQ